VTAQDLARRIARQRFDKIHGFRRLEARDAFAGEVMISDDVAVLPDFITTIALTVSPHLSSGTPITATSATSGWSQIARSTSAG
jgi:hypothetical protein